MAVAPARGAGFARQPFKGACLTLKGVVTMLYVGLDVHQKNTVATVINEQGECCSRQSVPTTPEGYNTLLKGVDRVETKVVFEAGRNWWYIRRLLKVHVDNIIMAHPLRVRAIAEARIKTDGRDSKALAELLRAGLIVQSHQPSEAIIALRMVVRERVRLSQERAEYKSRIRTILAREGHQCEQSDVSSPAARKAYHALPLEPVNREELEGCLRIIDEFTRERDRCDQVLEREALNYPAADMLRSIPGIGLFSAMLIISEIDDIHRFSSAEKLAAYCGLVSSVHQSGETCYRGRITKEGSSLLRWALVQCAHGCVKKPGRLQQFYTRLRERKGHGKAIVAAAHKMVKIIWHVLTKEVSYVPG